MYNSQTLQAAKGLQRLLWWDREGAQGIAVMRFPAHLLKQVSALAGLYAFALEIISCRILQFADIVKGYPGINNG